MSAPFEKSPKLREYINWAISEGVCAVKEGIVGKKSVIRFESENGYAFIVGHDDNEPLCHSEVAMLDRRLAIDAPFPKTPKPYR
ncbi:hypothetical protein [uncultured Roseovarius sp.]|uniref:hypothetical protein n=1 Tax=uncultured Roseovarius sp. TaxID=293344 RepID=UPI00262F6536|nr:hypothetical protein [uncultured Roseovarius sp.]